jgi:hypothetical protein
MNRGRVGEERGGKETDGYPLTGPMLVTTWTGKAYMFVTVEMNSRFGIGELLESKTEATEILKTVVVRLE